MRGLPIGSREYYACDMSTLSSDPGVRQNPSSDTRQVFAQKVVDYLESRPDYPAAMFTQLEAIGALPARAAVADLGSGTGLLTRALLERGHQVFALEPNDEMRLAAEQVLNNYPGFNSCAGSAEQTGLPDSSVDLVSAAQAFHWFDASLARDECLRILRPHGQVALIWNDRVLSDRLNQALDEVFVQFGGELRKVSMQQEERRQVPLFFGDARYQSFEFDHDHWLDRSGLDALVFSRSYMPARGSDKGLEVERAVSNVFERQAQAKRVLMRYRTLLLIGRPEVC